MLTFTLSAENTARKMFRLFFFCLSISIMIYCGETTVISDPRVNECDSSQSELKLVFITHRHGARTPVQKTMPFVTDKEKVKCKTEKVGWGQLTQLGIRNGYELGKYFKRRYGEYTSCHFNQSRLDIHSTNCARTEMTIEAAMAALFYPTDDNWSDDINWTPTPYSTCKTKVDPLLTVYNCPKFAKKFMIKLKSPVPGMEEYDELLSKLSDILGKNLTDKHAMCYIVNEAQVSQEHLGIPLKREMRKLMPELRECANDALYYLLGNGNAEDLGVQIGVLYKEFFDAADQAQLGSLGKPGPVVYIKSGHDINVAPVMYAAGVPVKEVPKYTAAFSLELRKVKKTGKYVVCPVHYRKPGAKEKGLKVRGCVGACGYQTFKALTAKYVMDKDTRILRCGITLNYLRELVIDIENSFI